MATRTLSAVGGASTSRNVEGLKELQSAALDAVDGVARVRALLRLVAWIERARIDPEGATAIPWEHCGTEGLQFLLEHIDDLTFQVERGLDTARAQ